MENDVSDGHIHIQSIESAVFPQYMLVIEQQNVDGTRPVRTGRLRSVITTTTIIIVDIFKVA